MAGVFVAGALAVVSLATTGGRGASFRAAAPRGSGASDESYAVTMSPMGTVQFPRVPQRVVTLDANYNDMLAAIGVGNRLLATGYRPNFYNGFYQQLGLEPGFSQNHLRYLAAGAGGAFDKELFYALHADVHHIDPIQLAAMRGWTAADVDEITRNVGPFFANRYSRDHNYHGDQPYEYYSLFELSRKVGEVYGRAERIEKLEAVYRALVQRIQRQLPPPDKRPRVGLIYNNGGRFTAYSLGNDGFGQAQYRDVGARDAFASIASQTYGAAPAQSTSLDLEGLLSVDPDILIVPFAVYPASPEGTSRASYEQLLTLRDDPIARRLTAFRTGRIFPGGTPLQGPIFYLFQIEMAAKQIYPNLFGPYRDDQAYPENEQLFDRREVAAIFARGAS